MTEKISIEKLSGVPRTLLIPLCGRSLAAKKYPQYDFHDPLAEETIQKLNFNSAEFSFDSMSMKGSIVRAKAIDSLAQDFFIKNPHGLGISLGTGLCTRFWRIDNSDLSWLDVDFPEVIELREKLLPKNPRHYSFPCSLLSNLWIKKAQEINKKPWFISIEGVLMYLKPSEVESFFKLVAELAPAGSELVFDYTNPLLIKLNIKPLAVLRSGTTFHWGISKLSEVEKLSPRFKCVNSPISFPISKLHALGHRIISTLLGGEVYALGHFKIN